MIYRFDNPDIEDNEQRAVWVRVPLSKIRDKNPSYSTVVINLGNKAITNEELFDSQGEYGPEGDSLCIDGQPVKASVTLRIANDEYKPELDPNISKRDKAALLRARALLAAEEEKQLRAAAAMGSSCSRVTLDNDIKLSDGTVLPKGMTVASNTLASVLTGGMK